MIKVRHMGRGEMRPPSHFLRDLRLIDPKLSVVWEPKAQRFAIVSPAPVSVFRKGYVTDYLVELNGQFAPLNGRVIKDLQYLMWEKNHMVSFDHYLRDMDRREEEKKEKADQQTRERMSDLAGKIDKFKKTKTFT